MGYIARFKKGTSVLDLSTGRYSLGMDFVPPRTNISAYMASGTSANRYGGAEKIGERASNQGLTFSVRILGSSNAEVERAIRDIAWYLRQAGDESEPLYFEWRPDNNVSFEPLWGQFGANLRCEVVFGTVDRWGRYGIANMRNKAVFAIVALEIKPFALGKQQRLGTAKGGVFTDTLGMADGRVRGISVAEETTNLITNPIFGHSTYDNDWTAGANLVATQNTDPNFVLFGLSSAKLVNPTSGAISFRQSINVGNTNSYILSCYAKRADGAAVSSSDLALYYASAQTTTFTSVGNGWYRCTCSVTGVASATNTGVNVAAYRSIYVDGFQLENKNYAMPLAYGDLLGCAWTGTAHDSTSTRTVAYLRLPYADAINVAENTIRYVWKAPTSASVYNAAGINARLMDSSGTAAYTLSWNSSTSRWNFTDGSNTIVESATSDFSEGDVIVFHSVCESGSIKLYKNGAQTATGDTYTQPAVQSYLYIGSTDTPDLHNNGEVMGFATYAYAMTAAEVLADYNNIYQVVADGQSLESFPFIWTKDGDDVVDNCYDSTRENWAVCAGIPGDAESDTLYYLATSDTMTNFGEILLCRIDESYTRFILPDSAGFFNDEGDVSDTACCGELKLNTTVGATADFQIATDSGTADATKSILNKNLYCAVRLADGASRSVNIYWVVYYAGTDALTSDTIGITTQTGFRLFLLPPVRMFSAKAYILGKLAKADIKFTAYSLYATDPDTSDTISVDYFAVFPEPVLRMDLPTSNNDDILLNNTSAFITVNSKAEQVIPTTGQSVNLLPGQYNILMSLIGTTTINPLTGFTITYSSIYVTPRWSIA